MKADRFDDGGDCTLEEQYLEWINDPAAQAEYRRWLAEDEKRRATLPDPFEIGETA